MEITPINAYAISYSPVTNKANNVPESNDSNIKWLTNEIEDIKERTIRFSGDGIDLSLVNTEGHKGINLPQSTLKMVDFQLKLMREAKTQRLAGQDTGDDIRDLANAYATVISELNENSENSLKNSKFLNDAFKSVSDFYFTKNARQQARNEAFTQSHETGVQVEDLRAILSKAAEAAKEQSSIFADTFTDKFKKLGLDGAYNLAMSRL